MRALGTPRPGCLIVESGDDSRHVPFLIAQTKRQHEHTDKRAHNDDGALDGLHPGHVGHACSNKRDGGRRARLEARALAQARRRRAGAAFCQRQFVYASYICQALWP